MTWDDYYERFYDWAESTQISRISSLTDFGSSTEITEIAQQFFDEKIASRLIKKAISAQVSFSPDEVVELMDYVDSETSELLLKTCNGTFSKEQFETLSDYCADDEILEALAKKSGIRIDLDDNEPYDDVYEEQPQPPKKHGLFGLLFAIGALAGNEKKHTHNGRCNGDCAHCPPHYGYRYGRWYYGHDHVHGCECGGNRGSGKMD